MGNDFNDQTTTSLGGATGEIPTTIKFLSLALDKKFEANDRLAEERHTELLTAVNKMKSAVDKDCQLCKEDVQKKFGMLKLWFSLVENPKLMRFIIILILLVIVLAWRGGSDLFHEAKNMVLLTR